MVFWKDCNYNFSPPLYLLAVKLFHVCTRAQRLQKAHMWREAAGVVSGWDIWQLIRQWMIEQSLDSCSSVVHDERVWPATWASLQEPRHSTISVKLTLLKDKCCGGPTSKLFLSLYLTNLVWSIVSFFFFFLLAWLANHMCNLNPAYCTAIITTQPKDKYTFIPLKPHCIYILQKQLL